MFSLSEEILFESNNNILNPKFLYVKINPNLGFIPDPVIQASGGKDFEDGST